MAIAEAQVTRLRSMAAFPFEAFGSLLINPKGERYADDLCASFSLGMSAL